MTFPVPKKGQVEFLSGNYELVKLFAQFGSSSVRYTFFGDGLSSLRLEISAATFFGCLT